MASPERWRTPEERRLAEEAVAAWAAYVRMEGEAQEVLERLRRLRAASIEANARLDRYRSAQSELHIAHGGPPD